MPRATGIDYVVPNDIAVRDRVPRSQPRTRFPQSIAPASFVQLALRWLIGPFCYSSLAQVVTVGGKRQDPAFASWGFVEI